MICALNGAGQKLVHSDPHLRPLDLVHAQQAVTDAIGDAPTTDNQYAALVSLCLGIGAQPFRASDALKEHRAGDHQAAAAAFLHWDRKHRDGKLLLDHMLFSRRMQERTLYLLPDHHEPAQVKVELPTTEAHGKLDVPPAERPLPLWARLLRFFFGHRG